MTNFSFTDNSKWPQQALSLKLLAHKFLAKLLKIVLDKMIANKFTQSNQMFFSAQLCNIGA